MEELFDLQRQLSEAKDRLGEIARDLRAKAIAEAEARCNYADAKNTYLIEMFAEEADDPKMKRSVAQREALYRSMYKDLRRTWFLSQADLSAERDFYDGVKSKIMALQTLIRLEESKMNIR